MSIGGGWKGLKAELSTTSSVEASYRTSTKVKEKGKIGDVVIKELAMGMCLRVQRVYERSVNLYLNNEAKGNSLTWDGPESWDELRIVSSALRDVKPLQFHPIRMSGTGHSDSLFLQAFPVFNVEKKLTDLHLVLSCEGWTHWFVYNGGTKTVGGDRLETLPMPDNKKPLITFIEAGDKTTEPGLSCVECRHSLEYCVYHGSWM
ncbi:hypothetical protein BGZ58_000141 [Dissophora ornata]|nr:hypothetical protein BGZ58_000141 [Dissophora ornata]